MAEILYYSLWNIKALKACTSSAGSRPLWQNGIGRAVAWKTGVPLNRDAGLFQGFRNTTEIREAGKAGN